MLYNRRQPRPLRSWSSSFRLLHGGSIIKHRSHLCWRVSRVRRRFVSLLCVHFSGRAADWAIARSSVRSVVERSSIAPKTALTARPLNIRVQMTCCRSATHATCYWRQYYVTHAEEFIIIISSSSRCLEFSSSTTMFRRSSLLSVALIVFSFAANDGKTDSSDSDAGECSQSYFQLSLIYLLRHHLAQFA